MMYTGFVIVLDLVIFVLEYFRCGSAVIHYRERILIRNIGSAFSDTSQSI